MKSGRVGASYAERLPERFDLWVREVLFQNSPQIETTGRSLLRAAFRSFPLLMLYGAAMGSYGLFNLHQGTFWNEILHLFYASSKIPLLMGVTFFLALPGFYVFYHLAGLAEDFPDVIRALINTNAVFALALASLTPITLLFYLSTPDYLSAVLFNGLMFGIAAVMRQIVLRHRYRHLIGRNVRHRLLLRLWFLVHAFVGIQCGWILRPWIGVPGADSAYFRDDAWSVAYLEVLKIIRLVMGI